MNVNEPNVSHTLVPRKKRLVLMFQNLLAVVPDKPKRTFKRRKIGAVPYFVVPKMPLWNPLTFWKPRAQD